MLHNSAHPELFYRITDVTNVRIRLNVFQEPIISSFLVSLHKKLIFFILTKYILGEKL